LKKESKIVTTNQTGLSTDLEKIIERYNLQNFKKPVSLESQEIFRSILHWVNSFEDRKIILDIGCGVGESTFKLASQNQEHLVIGIDKSISRIDRKNKFKKSLPSNCLLVRGDAIDLWLLFHQHKSSLNIVKQYILYPNPWPLKHHVKKRWHGHPIIPFVLDICENIELRSNWKIYLEEFNEVYDYFLKRRGELSLYEPIEFISPFEKKYCESRHLIYKLSLE